MNIEEDSADVHTRFEIRTLYYMSYLISLLTYKKHFAYTQTGESFLFADDAFFTHLTLPSPSFPHLLMYSFSFHIIWEYCRACNDYKQMVI